eukprot:5229486-Pyramimonas_sp.AAC.1
MSCAAVVLTSVDTCIESFCRVLKTVIDRLAASIVEQLRTLQGVEVPDDASFSNGEGMLSAPWVWQQRVIFCCGIKRYSSGGRATGNNWLSLTVPNGYDYDCRAGINCWLLIQWRRWRLHSCRGSVTSVTRLDNLGHSDLWPNCDSAGLRLVAMSSMTTIVND